MRSWLSVLITDAESKKVFDIPIAPSLYSLSNKMDNSLLAVRDINHKYIVVESIQDDNCIFHVAWYRSSTVSGFDRGDICNITGISAFGVESRFIHERKIER